MSDTPKEPTSKELWDELKGRNNALVLAQKADAKAIVNFVENRISVIRAILDARCEEAGIKRNDDGTYSVEPFTDKSVEETAEWLALMGYMLWKEENK